MEIVCEYDGDMLQQLLHGRHRINLKSQKFAHKVGIRFSDVRG